MPLTLDQLEAETLGLPSDERAWGEEIRRRLADFDAGRTQATPASDVFARARARLAR